MLKKFRVHLKSGNPIIVKAHHFVPDYDGSKVRFYKSEAGEDDEVFVALDAVEAIVPVSDDEKPAKRPSSSASSFR